MFVTVIGKVIKLDPIVSDHLEFSILCGGGGGIRHRFLDYIHFNMQRHLRYKPSRPLEAARINHGGVYL